MTKTLFVGLIFAIAIAQVLTTRVLIPGLFLLFKLIERQFEPLEPALASPVVPVLVTEEPTPKKPRPARRRRATTKAAA
jgi:hypothetical protein